MQSMKVIDAHIHLNLKTDSPLENLIGQMDANQVERVMLILNNASERKAFQDEINLYRNNKDRFWIASGLNIHEEESVKGIEVLLGQGINTCIKVHPHMFGLTKEEIPQVIDALAAYTTPVIVDSLYYGKEIEYHNGVEYGVAIGRAFPERKVVIAHSGSLDFLKCMMATRYMPNVFYDYSFTQTFFNRTSLRLDMVDFLRRTTNKIMWGSDFPSFAIDRAINDFMSIVDEAGITPEQLNDVVYNNAIKVYGTNNI